jgi:hypothetical protein
VRPGGEFHHPGSRAGEVAREDPVVVEVELRPRRTLQQFRDLGLRMRGAEQAPVVYHVQVCGLAVAIFLDDRDRARQGQAAVFRPASAAAARAWCACTLSRPAQAPAQRLIWWRKHAPFPVFSKPSVRRHNRCSSASPRSASIAARFERNTPQSKGRD